TKQPKPSRDTNRTRLIVAASVAGVFLLAAVVYGYVQLADKQCEYDNLFLRKQRVERQLTELAEDEKRIALLDDWNQSGVVWLDELYDLTDRFPDTERIRLTSLTGNQLTHITPTRPAATTGDPLNASAQNKYVAKLTLNGTTTGDDRTVDDLLRHFVEDGHYDV